MSDLIDRQEAISRAVELRMYGKPVKMVPVSELERLPKRGETTLPEQADSDRLGAKTGETCADVISRQAAMVVINCSGLDDDSKDTVVRVLEQLPSARPEERTEERTETHACDCISRQAAIDAFGLSEKTRKYGGDHSGYDTRMLYEIQGVLEGLPSAQPSGKDPIEREAVVDVLHDAMQGCGESEEDLIGDIVSQVDLLPSAQPYTEDEIQKIQDLEQAQLDKMYELGKQTAQPEPQWIPCSERLPEDDTEVFVYLFDRPSPFIAWIDDCHWYTEEFEVEKDNYPLAWMPLPEPYKEKDNERA